MIDREFGDADTALCMTDSLLDIHIEVGQPLDCEQARLLASATRIYPWIRQYVRDCLERTKAVCDSIESLRAETLEALLERVGWLDEPSVGIVEMVSVDQAAVESAYLN